VLSNSAYVTYDPETGREIDQATGKVLLKPVVRSKYPEDIHPGNHTSVFGSYWRDGQWGYQCCHSFVKNSYCTGEEGKRGFEEEEAQRLGRNLVADTAAVDEEVHESGVSNARKRKDLEDTGNEGDGEREKRAKTEDMS